MSVVTVAQVARNIAEYVNRVACRRESFTPVRGKKPLAELRLLPAGARLSELPGLSAVKHRVALRTTKRVVQWALAFSSGASHHLLLAAQACGL